MQFDFNWNGIDFVMEYTESKFKDQPTPDDICFACDEGIVIVSHKHAAFLAVDDLTEKAKDEIIEEAFDFAYEEGLLNPYLTD